MRRMSKFDGTNVTFVRHNYPIRITKITLGKAGGSLAPAYDLKPVPTDLKARVLSTNIDLDEGTCSLDLLQAASELFKAVGARSAEINRMASAFEHDDLTRALSRVDGVTGPRHPANQAARSLRHYLMVRFACGLLG